MRKRTWPSDAHRAAQRFAAGELTEEQLEEVLVHLEYFPPGMDDEFQGVDEDTGTMHELTSLMIRGTISAELYERIVNRITV